MMDNIVETLPTLDYKEHREIATIRDNIQKGIDPIISPTDKIEITRNEIQHEFDEQLTQQDDSIQPSFSKNIEELYHLTSLIQHEISFVLSPQFTGKMRYDNQIRDRINRFLNDNIPLYSSQLVVYIESLILVDHFQPSKFHGYKNLERMIETSNGFTKMNHLQSLVNMCRQLIPADVTMKTVQVIEPAISKSANPRDA